MASFNWISTPKEGACTTCGSSACDRGFVDCVGETNVRRGDSSISGVVDIVICGYCLEQAAKLVGSASKQETMDMAQRVIEAEEENQKLRDEVAAHQERYYQLVDNLSTKGKEKANA